MQLMGILNLTPDSYFDGGQFNSLEKGLEKGIQIYKDGADWIDIGGESTRPGAMPVPEEEEFDRVIPVIKQLKKLIPIPISVDTIKPRIAKAAIEAGASLINDISGFSSPEMIKLAANTETLICLMHMQGTPATMQKNPSYPRGVVLEIYDWFQQKTQELIRSGIKPENIILDPGIGFGKTVDDNLKILHNLQKFKSLGFPLLIGLSRKSFMAKTLSKLAPQLLPATISMNTAALLNGADIIRVHDVTEHRDVLDMIKKYKEIE